MEVAPRPGLLEPLLQWISGTGNEEDLADYLFFLSELGGQDERIYLLLSGRTETHPVHGTLLFQTYRDPRSVRQLLDLAWSLTPDGHPEARRLATEVLGALQHRRHQLPEELRMHLELCRVRRRPR